MPGAASGLAVQIDQRPETARLSPDDGDHQRETQRSGARERLRRAAHADPDRKWILNRARVDALPRQRRAERARPVDVFVLADLQEQLEFLREQRVVILEIESEQRKGLDRRPASDHHLGPAARQQIERGEFLEQAHRVGGAQDRHRAAEAYTPGARRGRAEDHRGRGIEELPAMVLADSERVQADLIGALDLSDEIAQPIGGADGPAVLGERGGEAIDSDFHGGPARPASTRQLVRLGSKNRSLLQVRGVRQCEPGSGPFFRQVREAHGPALAEAAWAARVRAWRSRRIASSSGDGAGSVRRSVATRSAQPVARRASSTVIPSCTPVSVSSRVSGSGSSTPRSVITRLGPPPVKPRASRERPPLAWPTVVTKSRRSTNVCGDCLTTTMVSRAAAAISGAPPAPGRRFAGRS